MSDKNKKLVFKKAYFSEGFNGTIEQIVLGILERLPNKNDRTYKSDMLKSYEIGLIERSEQHGGIFVRIHGSENGAISLINQEAAAAHTELEQHLPPEKRQFLSEEVILYFNGNHILACDLGQKDTLIQNVLGDIGLRAGVIDKSLKWRISDVPNKTTLKKAKEIGIKHIELGIDGYLASIEEFNHGRSDIMGAIFGTPAPAEAIRKRANTFAKLIIWRGYLKKSEQKKDEWLTNVGEIIIKESDDYTLILENGNKISTDKLKVSKSIKLKREASTISYEHAKLALINFYKELRDNGSLDW